MADGLRTVRTWSTALALADDSVLVKLTRQAQVLQPWRRPQEYPLPGITGAGVRHVWPWAILCLVGFVHDEQIGDNVSTETIVRVRARKYGELLQWAANVSSAREQVQHRPTTQTDQPTQAALDLLTQGISHLHTRIDHQWKLNEARDRNAMTGVAAFVVLLGLVVNNLHNLSNSIQAHALLGAGLFLVIVGLFAAANTVLRSSMRSSVTPISSFRRFYDDHIADDPSQYAQELADTGEGLRKVVVNNLLELTLQRRRLSAEFMALILGAACIGLAFAL